MARAAAPVEGLAPRGADHVALKGSAASRPQAPPGRKPGAASEATCWIGSGRADVSSGSSAMAWPRNPRPTGPLRVSWGPRRVGVVPFPWNVIPGWLRPVAAGGWRPGIRAAGSRRALAAGSSPGQEPQNMAGRANGADPRIYATVAVEGRARLVPLPPEPVSTATKPACVVREGAAPEPAPHADCAVGEGRVRGRGRPPRPARRAGVRGDVVRLAASSWRA
jgi:hypothetical protein